MTEEKEGHKISTCVFSHQSPWDRGHSRPPEVVCPFRRSSPSAFHALREGYQLLWWWNPTPRTGSSLSLHILVGTAEHCATLPMESPLNSYDAQWHKILFPCLFLILISFTDFSSSHHLKTVTLKVCPGLPTGWHLPQVTLPILKTSVISVLEMTPQIHISSHYYSWPQIWFSGASSTSFPFRYSLLSQAQQGNPELLIFPFLPNKPILLASIPTNVPRSISDSFLSFIYLPPVNCLIPDTLSLGVSPLSPFLHLTNLL